MTPFSPTPEQEEAIGASLGRQLLVAGAGAGKTTVMARRIASVVDRGLVRPDQVLALTFSNKAAQHLKEHVRSALGPDADVTVGTYHSFGAALVADHALELGLTRSTRVLNRAQAWQLLFTVFDELRFRHRATLHPQVLLDDALALAARCSDHLVGIDDVAADCRLVAEKGPWKKMRTTAALRQELCQVVAAYARAKRERDLLDFGDQIALAVRLLQDHPDVARSVREQHRVVLLDEYQDTNFAQRRLVQLVCDDDTAVTAVGDDMQSIYGFRGAHLANILRFTDHFAPPAGVVATLPLQTTFRFGPDLVALANLVQAQVSESLAKELVPAPGAPTTRISCFLAADETEEAEAIAEEIAARGRPWSSTAILCRKRRLFAPIVAALARRGVDYDLVGASGLLDRPEVVDLVSWLEVLVDPQASVALLRILTGPRYRLGLGDLAALARHAREEAAAPRREGEGGEGSGSSTGEGRHEGGRGEGGVSGSGRGRREGGERRGGEGGLAAAVASVGDDPSAVPGLGQEAAERIGAFCRDRAELAEAACRLSVADLVEAVAGRTGLWRAGGSRGIENLLRFCELAADFEPIEGDPGLLAFVEYLQLLRDSDEDLAEAHPADSDAVRVMTIHQAKGLEFDHVYVPGLAGSGRSKIFPDGRPGENALTNSAALPWWLREDEGIPSWTVATQAEIDEVIRRRKRDEEWRLFYVACTRARVSLTCSAAHWYGGTAEPQGPSELYELVSGRPDLVTERFRHEPATADPEVAARQRRREELVARRRPVPAPVEPAQLELALERPTARGAEGKEPGSPWATRSRSERRLAVTSLVTYARCPRQYYWSSVRPLPRRWSRAAKIGAEVHRWIERRADRQLPLLPSGDDETDVAEPGPPTVTAGLRASFLAGPWASLDPLRVEAPFVLPVGDALVRGRIDAVYERDDLMEIVDFKTGRPVPSGDASAGLQLDAYGVAAVDTWEADPRALRTTYCYLSTDGPATAVSVDWDPNHLDVARSRLEGVLEGIASEDYEPTPGTWCSGCDFAAVCPAVREGG